MVFIKIYPPSILNLQNFSQNLKPLKKFRVLHNSDVISKKRVATFWAMQTTFSLKQIEKIA